MSDIRARVTHPHPVTHAHTPKAGRDPESRRTPRPTGPGPYRSLSNVGLGGPPGLGCHAPTVSRITLAAKTFRHRDVLSRRAGRSRPGTFSRFWPATAMTYARRCVWVSGGC